MTAKKGGTPGPVGLKKGENKLGLYKLTVTVRQTYVELENSNIIPQDMSTEKLHKITDKTYFRTLFGS